MPPKELAQSKSGTRVQVWCSIFVKWKKLSMTFGYLKNNCLKGKSELASILLLIVSVFLGCAALFKVAGFFAASAKAEGLVERALADSSSDAGKVQSSLAASRAMADELKRENLFAPPAPKQNPVRQVQGILGDEVLIDGEWHKIGDSIEDARIVTIEPTLVRIEWEGSERVFGPMNDSGSQSPAQQGSRRTRTAKTARTKGTEAGAGVVVVVGSQRPVRARGASSEKLSEKEKAKKQNAEKKLRLLAEKKKFAKLLSDKPKKKQAKPKEPVSQAKKDAVKKPKKKSPNAKK